MLATTIKLFLVRRIAMHIQVTYIVCLSLSQVLLANTE